MLVSAVEFSKLQLMRFGISPTVPTTAPCNWVEQFDDFGNVYHDTDCGHVTYDMPDLLLFSCPYCAGTIRVRQQVLM